ncbi:MAG: hypothetical protein M0R46_17775 [Candidatus Muirbacterium halophilum]|nr:hypothetical protein [Candidatus Muirbacterium halophilum]MCK9477766.1 hypothetical protein [Candidatus Muirbacterium halophilum]
MTDNSTNAGVRALNGFALQRNTALFILLDEFNSKFKDKKYFLSLEHLDDFLFCFLDKEEKSILIEAYQSKKKSSSAWLISLDFTDIIKKLLETGNKLLKDPIPKIRTYNHNLYFISNSAISLKKNKSNHNVTINEENRLVAFTDLNIEIQEKFKSKFKSKLSSELEDELSNLKFNYVALTTTDKEQQNQLVGKLEEVFKEDIIDYRAAVNTLITLFRGMETTYNQGGTAKLLDKTKRVSSDDIHSTIKTITTKSKAFDYWRKEIKTITKVLNIKPWEKDSFKLYFESAFELFKSMIEIEHQKIYKFVEKNYINCKSTQEEEDVLELFEKFKFENTTTFEDLNLKAIIYAAYFESINKREP